MKAELFLIKKYSPAQNVTTMGTAQRHFKSATINHLKAQLMYVLESSQHLCEKSLSSLEREQNRLGRSAL